MSDTTDTSDTSDATEGKSKPSFAEYASSQSIGGDYVSGFPVGEYTMQFLSGEVVETKWGESIRYKFNHEGEEKILDSGSKALLQLSGREGQTIILIKGVNPNTGRAQYSLK